MLCASTCIAYFVYLLVPGCVVLISGLGKYVHRRYMLNTTYGITVRFTHELWQTYADLSLCVFIFVMFLFPGCVTAGGRCSAAHVSRTHSSAEC